MAEGRFGSPENTVSSTGARVEKCEVSFPLRAHNKICTLSCSPSRVESPDIFFTPGIEMEQCGIGT